MTWNPGEICTILGWALLNPLVVLVAAYVGRKADQWQKVVVAAFAGGFAGFLIGAVAQNLGLIHLLPRSFAGLFLASFCLSIVAGAAGYATRRT